MNNLHRQSVLALQRRKRNGVISLVDFRNRKPLTSLELVALATKKVPGVLTTTAVFASLTTNTATVQNDLTAR